MSSAFYIFENGLYLPQQPATGSWNRQHQNGVAAGGLLTASLEAAVLGKVFQIVRLTIDLMRAVPFQAVAVEVGVLREGRQMAVLDAAILADSEVVATASAVCLRVAETPVVPEPALDYPMSSEAPAKPVTSVLGAGHPMETRVVKGEPRQPGPGAYWTRFNAELIAGRPTSAVVRAAMAADIASAPSSVLDAKAWSYANVDLSVYFTRQPVGDWTLIECETTTAGNGNGLVSSILADENGPFARAHQTLFVAPLPKRA